MCNWVSKKEDNLSHILETLSQNVKIATQNQIDKIISKLLPDKEKNPTLFKIVFSNLILGPCWKNYNEKAPSFENNTYK